MKLPGEERRRLVRDQARSAEGAWVTCSTPSMEPTVKVGERVRVRAVDRIRVGDVIVFETGAGDAYVLHRVLLVVPGVPWFVHGGDAQPENEPGLARVEWVIGRVDVKTRRPKLRQTIGALKRIGRAVGRRFLGIAR